MADALTVNQSVTRINIAKNTIDDEGALALADALEVNTSVVNIDLSGNTIGDGGASALADALKVNMSVTRVNLVTMQSVLKAHRRWLMR